MPASLRLASSRPSMTPVDHTAPPAAAFARPGVEAFAVMSGLEALARATMATVIPLQAYALLQSKRDVSALFFAVSITALVGSLFVPLLIRRFRRRWIYTGGAAALALAAALMAFDGLGGQAAGMAARSLGAAATNIALNLYVMDYVRKRDYVRSEPLRMLGSTLGWS